MDLQTRKFEFIKEFLKVQSEEVIIQLENLFKGKNEGIAASKPMSTNKLNARIDKSEDDFRNGRYKTSSELLSKYK